MNNNILPSDIINVINSNDILENIYYMGAYDRKALFAIKIQRWYRSFRSVDDIDDDINTKGECLRIMHKLYGNGSMSDYPPFAIRKTLTYDRVLEPFTGDINKRTDVIRWIRNNMDIGDIMYVGF